MAKPQHKFYFFILLFFLFTAPLSASSVSEYKNSWEYKALQLQSKIDQYAPFGKASFITTHNSYNAGVYSQNGSYIDPNQKISIYDQLEIGVRSIELDVHYTFSSTGFWPWEWKFFQALKLSHGNGDVGTHPNDRFFTQGLSEVKTWLENNRDQVLLIYIEDHMEGQYEKAINELNQTIGSYVYKPNGCQRLPMGLTKNKVLKAGKQVLIIGGNCKTDSWANYAFNGIFPSTESLKNFKPYPVCMAGNKDAKYLQSNLVRIFEDSTKLSAMFGDPGPPIKSQDAYEMTKAGIGAIGLDQIVPFDPRLKAQIWSWQENEPNNAGDGENFAVHMENGRFNDVVQDQYHYVACKNPKTNEWFITSGTYKWFEAKEAVENEFPGQGLVFAVPVNGYENALLVDLKKKMDIKTVWLNYSDHEEEGNWIPFSAK